MEEKEYVKIDVHKLYQLLITELRYGYTRNNHLMPSSAYNDAADLLDRMLEANEGVAVSTAKQLCEECIGDELAMKFSEGLEDDFGNRKAAIDFIEYLLGFIRKREPGYKPYNMYMYDDNMKRSKEMRYSVFSIKDAKSFDAFSHEVPKDRELLKGGLELDKAYEYLFSTVLGMKNEDVSFNVMKIFGGIYGNMIVGKELRICEPERHKGKVYLILKEENK